MHICSIGNPAPFSPDAFRWEKKRAYSLTGKDTIQNVPVLSARNHGNSAAVHCDLRCLELRHHSATTGCGRSYCQLFQIRVDLLNERDDLRRDVIMRTDVH